MARLHALGVVLVLLWAGSGIARAQRSAPLELSLEEALTRVARDNFQVRSAAADVAAAQAQKRQARAAFLPRLTLSETQTSTTDPVNAFSFKLKQERFAQSDFSLGALNDPDRVDNFTTKIELQQPIFNPDALFQRRAAAEGARAAKQARNRTEAAVTFQVKRAYFGLVLAQRRAAVVDSALATARANEDQAQDVFEQGLINRADLLAAQVRVLELEGQQSEAQAGAQNASDQLRYLLGIEEDVQITPTAGLQPERAVPVDTVDIARVNRERSDMQALRFQAEAARAQLRAQQTSFLPSLNVQGGYEWNDDQPFGTGGESWTAGVSLRWNVFSGFERIGAAQKARADLRRAELALRDQSVQNGVEIADALRRLETTRLQVRQAEAAVEQARESLRIRTDRFAQGLEKTTDLLNAETMLANQRLAYLQRLYAHRMAQYRLELLTERTLTP